VKPGETVCLKSGTRKALRLSNIRGTSAQPVTIKNCGGAVVFDDTVANTALYILGSSYFRLTGTGASGISYGIQIQRTSKTGRSSGLEIGGFATDYEVDHLEITGASYGLYARTATDSGYQCHPEYETRKDAKNVNLHDLYVHDTLAKGFFLATPSCDEAFVEAPCPKALSAADFQALIDAGQPCRTKADGTRVCDRHRDRINDSEVHHSIVENTGYQTVQIGCGRGNKLHHNRTGAHGLRAIGISDAEYFGKIEYETVGFNFQGYDGEIYANYVDSSKATGNAIGLGAPGGNVRVYNNIIIGGLNNPVFHPTTGDPHLKGKKPFPLYVQSGSLNAAVEPIYFVNNTILDSFTYARFDAFNKVGVPVVVRNNLGVAITDTKVIRNGGFATTGFAQCGDLTGFKAVADVPFVNVAAGNYAPAANSSAVNQGVAQCGLLDKWILDATSKDLLDTSRVKDGKIDVGAVER
jgi:hypothetical protein